MGHRNYQFTGHMIDMETNQQGPHRHPEPTIFYGSISNYRNPNFHSVIPPPVNQCNFNFHHMPERHNYGIPQLSVPQHQPPAPNLDLAIGAPFGPFNPHLPPPSGIQEFHHGGNDHRFVGFPAESMRASFKRKNAEGASGNYTYHNATAGPSSSAPDAPMLDVPSFLRPEYIGNDPNLMVENGARSARNRPRIIGHEPIMAHNGGHLIPGNFPAQPIPLPGNHWVDMQYNTNHGDPGSLTWTHAPPHFPHDMSAALNGSSIRVLHPPALPQGHPGAHCMPPAVQGVGGYNVNHSTQLAAPTRLIPAISSSNTGISHFQDIVEAGSSFQAPVPPTIFRSNRPPRREIILDSYGRHTNIPYMRVLPEDEVAILGFPGYHEAAVIDLHRDMRLDIDHMSYEELLALGEQIGSVGTGLKEEFIQNNLKIGTFVSSAACVNVKESPSQKQHTNFCVICQMDYENGEEIGTVSCGHEYHRECVTKWLLTKNTCPVCNSTALMRKANDL